MEQFSHSYGIKYSSPPMEPLGLSFDGHGQKLPLILRSKNRAFPGVLANAGHRDTLVKLL